MTYHRFFILLLFSFIINNSVNGQSTPDELKEELKGVLDDTTRVDKLNQIALSLLGTNPAEAILHAQEGLKLAVEIEDKEREAQLTKAIGLGHYYKAEYFETLEHWEKALMLFESISNSKGVSNLLSNIGSVYETRGDQTKALDYHLRALRIGEKDNDSLRIATATQNIGVVYSNLDQHELSIKYYTQSLELCQHLGYDQCIGLSYMNISEVYEDLDSLDQAVDFVNRAIQILRSNDDPLLPSAMIVAGKYKIKQNALGQALSIAQNAYEVGKERNLKATMQLAKNLLGTIQLKNKNYHTAIAHFSEAIELGRNIGNNADLAEAYEGYIASNDALKNYELSGIAKDSLINVNKQIFNIEKDNSLENLQLEYDLENRETEINLLNKESEIQALTLTKAIRNRNGFAAITALMLIFTGLIYWLYKKVNLARQRSDELLLNILPAETAEELKQHGYTTAKSHDKVGIMFTDFEGFSKIAQDLSPQDLVKSIDFYFKKFDEISSKYHLEKIKTIGDSYLTAFGLRGDHTDVSDIVFAALEMQSFVQSMMKNPSEEISQPFPMRIGIHLGTVVAGVVGVKKFQYDIWGNAVNIASRIESSSISGKVAISETLYNEIQSNTKFTFEKRESINVKNIGAIQTYFVDAV